MSELKKSVSDRWRHVGRAFLRGLVKLKNVWITGAILTLCYFIIRYVSDWLGQPVMMTIVEGIVGVMLIMALLIMGLTLTAIATLLVLLVWFWLRDLWDETREEQPDELTDDGD
jgi:hypothetical protein